MKDVLQGCSPSSPEGIELNLARATKSGGLNKNDIAAVLIAQKVMASLQVDPKILAQVINIMKTVADNGVPAVEIARVLNDGMMPMEITEHLTKQAVEALAKDFAPADVDAYVNLYDNLRLKSNIPLDVIEHIDNSLIQVRCSLEDVADNMVSSQLARGEKETMVIRALCETLSKTGSSPEIVATTMMAALRRAVQRSECDIMKDIGRTMHEQGTEKENLQKAMTELLLNLLNEDPDSYDLRQEALKALEQVLKEAGSFANDVRAFMDTLELPPEPPDPKILAEIERQRAEEEAKELERIRAEEEAAAAKAAAENKLKNPNLDRVSDSRRGSAASLGAGSRRGSASSVTLGGVERRGSYYGDDISKKATVAMVVDDPDSKDKINALMDEQDNGPDLEATLKAIRSGKVTDEDVSKLMQVFETSGIVSSAGGVTRLRKMSDLRNTLEATSRSFDQAIEEAQNREVPQVSEKNRKLMEEVLRRSQENQQEMSSRVTALLAGSALTTTAGVRIERRDTIEQVDYTAVGDDLSKLKERYKPRRRKAQSEVRGPVSIHQANTEELEYRAACAGIRVQRRSIKRMSLAITQDFRIQRPPALRRCQRRRRTGCQWRGRFERNRRGP